MGERKLSQAQVRSIAARLLDDMAANIMPHRLKSYDKHDIEEVAISLQEMLSDECVAEERNDREVSNAVRFLRDPIGIIDPNDAGNQG